MPLLETTPYQHPRKATMKASEEDYWTFSHHGTQGASLADAYDGKLEGLDARDDVLLPAGFVKVTFALQVPGYPPYRRAKSVQRVKRGTALPTLRSRVVECVAEAMALFLKQSVGIRPRDTGVVFGAGGVEFRDMYLLALHRYGRTLVPVIGLAPRPAYRELDWHETLGGYMPQIPWETDTDRARKTIEA